MIKIGRYELVKRLARGGMAEVLLARQAGPAGFEKLLVIKRLLSSLSDQKDIVRMFLNEARIAARLTHPNIVQIFNLGKVDGEYFIAMEYVNGRDLRSVQKKADKQGTPLPYELSTYVLACVCRALHHAHNLRDPDGESLGLVHRDVTPHNVLLSFSGDVKLADFGIAKATALAAETQAGVLKGKFAYMSPEQIRGETLDARSDIFSAGILLHELTCWQRLFRRETDFATIQSVENDPIPPPSALRDDVPDALEQVIMRALDRDRDKRYATAQEMQLDLEAVIADLGWRSGPVELSTFMTNLFWLRAADQAGPFAHGVGPLTRSERGNRGPRDQFLDDAPNPRGDQHRKLAAADARGRLSTTKAMPTEATDHSATNVPTVAYRPGRAAGIADKGETGVVPAAAFEVIDGGPPTVIQPPSFDDVEPESAGDTPLPTYGPNNRIGPQRSSGAQQMVRPSPLRGDPVQVADSIIDFVPHPGNDAIRRERALHIFLIVAIVVCLSLAAAILILIATSHGA